jgi:Arc/MetJ-type ribon-helix-helix transcriptional regulator
MDAHLIPMIPVTRKEPTEKKIIKLPDKLVEEIDRVAIGLYSSRSEFLNEAIRSFTRDRINTDRKVIVKIQRTFEGDALAMEALKRSQISLWKLGEKMWKYESSDFTAVTAYVTSYQLETIRTCFLFDDGPLKTLQDYARLAAAVQVETIDEERNYVRLIDKRRTKTSK